MNGLLKMSGGESVFAATALELIADVFSDRPGFQVD
jgi:hypothetical protein